jgi:hypothetical protein
MLTFSAADNRSQNSIAERTTTIPHKNLAGMFGIAHSEWPNLEANISLLRPVSTASYVPAISL